jgi:hypothetical protein
MLACAVVQALHCVPIRAAAEALQVPGFWAYVNAIARSRPVYMQGSSVTHFAPPVYGRDRPSRRAQG